ncbi:collagen-like protein [Orbus sturtevantii]|uniref:collagen-like triple helix repeat-containing protein n=1 Tax=Orbus sturtevantii TaxID=3074109 RepID=UPI00370DDE55
MAERQNTGNAIPSNAVRDFNDNTIIVDEWTNSDAEQTMDRFNNPIPTRSKLTSELTQVIAEAIVAKNEVEKAAEHILSITQGPKGEKGDAGPQGEQGPQGEAGPQGEKGETVTLSDSLTLASSTVAASSNAVQTLNALVEPIYRSVAVDPNNVGGTLLLFAPDGSYRYSLQVKADGHNGVWDDVNKKWLYCFNPDGYLVHGIVPSIGVGQSYQNVTSSRLNYVTYTNTTSRPILASVLAPSGNVTVIKLNGVEVFKIPASTYLNFIIPPGTVYSANLAATAVSGRAASANWVELR